MNTLEWRVFFVSVWSVSTYNYVIHSSLNMKECVYVWYGDSLFDVIGVMDKWKYNTITVIHISFTDSKSESNESGWNKKNTYDLHGYKRDTSRYQRIHRINNNIIIRESRKSRRKKTKTINDAKNTKTFYIIRWIYNHLDSTLSAWFLFEELLLDIEEEDSLIFFVSLSWNAFMWFLNRWSLDELSIMR